MLGILSIFLLASAELTLKISLGNAIRVPNDLDSDQDGTDVLIWVQIVCKGY